MLSKKQPSYPWSSLSAAAVLATLALSEGTILGRENLGRSLVNSSLLCRYSKEPRATSNRKAGRRAGLDPPRACGNWEGTPWIPPLLPSACSEFAALGDGEEKREGGGAWPWQVAWDEQWGRETSRAHASASVREAVGCGAHAGARGRHLPARAAAWAHASSCLCALTFYPFPFCFGFTSQSIRTFVLFLLL
jgi:hypothetical protein